MADEQIMVPLAEVERLIVDVGAVIAVAMHYGKGDPTTAIAKLEQNRSQIAVASTTGWEADVVDLAQRAVNQGGEIVEADDA